jgi:hypothetical protein
MSFLIIHRFLRVLSQFLAIPQRLKNRFAHILQWIYTFSGTTNTTPLSGRGGPERKAIIRNALARVSSPKQTVMEGL